MKNLTISLIVILSAFQSHASSVQQPEAACNFMAQNCAEYHEAGTIKGKLDLNTLDFPKLAGLGSVPSGALMSAFNSRRNDCDG